MLRISQIGMAAWNVKRHVVSQRRFDGTTDPERAASSEPPVDSNNLPERMPASLVPPIPATIIETTRPPSSIEGWETEGGAQPPSTDRS